MKAVLDAGALVAVDKGDRRLLAMLRVLALARVPVATSAAVVAQVWRNGARQARLARVLSGVGIRPLSDSDAREIGPLLRVTNTRDIVDAHVALMADSGDRVLTSDAADLRALLVARKVQASLISV